MTDSVPVAEARRTGRGWDVLRIALVLTWVVTAALAWWTAPREQSYDQARADLAAGRLTAYQWGDHWDTGSSRRWFDGATLQSSGTLGPLIMWRTPAGRVHWTDTRAFLQVSTTGAADDANYSGAGAVAVAQDLRAAGVDGYLDGDVDPLGSVTAGLGVVLAVVFLGVVVSGPAPVLGTRWFWFWLVSTAPFALGLLFWLGRERPWSRSAAHAVRSGDPVERKRGLLGLGIGLLTTFLVSVVLLILNRLLGDGWVPQVNG